MTTLGWWGWRVPGETASVVGWRLRMILGTVMQWPAESISLCKLVYDYQSLKFMFGRSFLESWRWFQHVTHISLGSWSLQFQNGKKEIAWGTLRVPISAVMYLWKMSVYWYSNVVIPFSRYELGGLQHRSPSNSCFWEPQRGFARDIFWGLVKVCISGGLFTILRTSIGGIHNFSNFPLWEPGWGILVRRFFATLPSPIILSGPWSQH